MDLNQEQIRQIVKITIDELTKAKLLKTDNYQAVLQIVENELNKFYKGYKTDVNKALHQLSDDPYIDIIHLQYRDGKTLEWIAEHYKVDVSTIKRNKKRLIKSLYELLEVQL